MATLGTGVQQRVASNASEVAAAIGPDHDAADRSVDQRAQAPNHMHLLAAVGEESPLAIVDPTAVDQLVPVVERRSSARPLEQSMGATPSRPPNRASLA